MNYIIEVDKEEEGIIKAAFEVSNISYEKEGNRYVFEELEGEMEDVFKVALATTLTVFHSTKVFRENEKITSLSDEEYVFVKKLFVEELEENPYYWIITLTLLEEYFKSSEVLYFNHFPLFNMRSLTEEIELLIEELISEAEGVLDVLEDEGDVFKVLIEHLKLSNKYEDDAEKISIRFNKEGDGVVCLLDRDNKELLSVDESVVEEMFSGAIMFVTDEENEKLFKSSAIAAMLSCVYPIKEIVAHGLQEDEIELSELFFEDVQEDYPLIENLSFVVCESDLCNLCD